VTQAANDQEQVASMMATVEAQSGQRPEAVIADSGYCSEKNREALAAEPPAERRSKPLSPRSGRSIGSGECARGGRYRKARRGWSG
jgi:hypothetical protein